MQKPEIVTIAVGLIDPNPWRNMGTYPPIHRKVQSLMGSIASVGMWESIIVRPHPTKENRFEQAFGHQRIFAAKELKMQEVPTIVRHDLTDEMMLQMLGRENGEDYSADFLVMLNTWEAGFDYLKQRDSKEPEAVATARLLGWMRFQAGSDGKPWEVMNDVAVACNHATRLILGGYNSRDEFEDLSVRTARDIVMRAASTLTTIDNIGKAQNASPKEIEQAKKHVGAGVRETAKDVRAGTIAHRHVGAQVGLHTMKAGNKEAQKKGKVPKLFPAYCREVVAVLLRTLNGDATADRLRQIAEVIAYVREPEHKADVRAVSLALNEVSERAVDWQRRISLDTVKPFPATARIGGPKK